MRGLPKFDDPNLVVGAEDFSDAGVYRLRDDLLIVQSVDFFPPLVDDPYTYGQIAAANSLSDIFAMGGRPVTALNVVGFPDDKLELGILNQILKGGADKVIEAGAVVAGGHTVRDVEIKYGLSVTGVVEPEKLITNSAAKPGDALILTKGLGTGFITTAFKAGRCPEDVLQTAVEGMAQLNVIGCDIAQEFGANASTDITGFGLAGHAGEMAQASNVTVILELNRLPVLPGAEDLARRGNHTRASASNRSFADPFTQIDSSADELRLDIAFDAQTSGGLLIALPAENAEQAVSAAREQGARFAAVVGSVTEQQDNAVVIRN